MAIKVLIVDDSVTARNILADILGSDERMEVVGMASDAFKARDMVVELKPDVICLDINMPRMDGVTFLQKLMKYVPTPVVMVSSLTKSSAKETLEALEAGAVDYVQKPKGSIFEKNSSEARILIEKVALAAKSKVHAEAANPLLKKIQVAKKTDKIVVIGSSTGGVDALKVVLTSLPENMPPILIVQHMPNTFVPSFAARLDKQCALKVKVAQNGERVEENTVYISPGGYHMVVRGTINHTLEVGQGDNVNGHCPSVDVLFNSAAKSLKEKAVAVILTGMGNDGAKGMLHMHQAGAKTIAQSEKTCVVYGMPKEAVKLGGVDKVVDLQDISQEILKAL